VNSAPTLVLAGGVVADGLHSGTRRADVAFSGDRIAAVAEGIRASDTPTIDVSDRVVAPGFIDIHTHSDLTLLEYPGAASKVMQGVTTEVVGNCGLSPYPVARARAPMHAELMACAAPANVDLAWLDFDGWAARIEDGGVAINVASLVGHGALRVAVMGADPRPPSSTELNAMRRMLEDAFEQGAFGWSTGLTYVPSRYAAATEIEHLAAVAAQHGRLYATHSRGITEHWITAIDEATSAARATGVRVQFSHLAINDPRRWGNAELLLRRFDEARANGIDIAFDVYPYDASASSLTQYLPAWITAGGVTQMRTRLTEARMWTDAVADVSKGWGGGVPWQWDRVVIVAAPGADDGMVGRSVADLAAESNVDPAEVAVRLCHQLGNGVQIALFSRSDGDMRAFLCHPLSVVGSDGSTQSLTDGAGAPHPRSFGTHPRVLGRHVRQLGDLDLGAAVAKMTGRVAQRLGMQDRGRLLPGHIADVTVFDPEHVLDTATFERPRNAPVGVTDVFVAGQEVLRNGVLTGHRPGHVLRANA
jgi:N-acyl-D-amino-acid deacylase